MSKKVNWDKIAEQEYKKLQQSYKNDHDDWREMRAVVYGE